MTVLSLINFISYYVDTSIKVISHFTYVGIPLKILSIISNNVICNNLRTCMHIVTTLKKRHGWLIVREVS